MTLSKIPQEEAFLKVFDPALFSFFFFLIFHSILKSLLLWSIIILGPSLCFLTPNAAGVFFSTGIAAMDPMQCPLSFPWHWPQKAASHKTLRHFKRYQSKKKKSVLHHQELKGFSCFLSAVFCFKDHYCNKFGGFGAIQVSHHSWILPHSQLHSQQYRVKNIDINICIYASRYTLQARVCASTQKRAEAGSASALSFSLCVCSQWRISDMTALESAVLCLHKRSSSDSRRVGLHWDTVSAVYFNQQCLEKLPGTTSKSQEWAILRLTSQSRFSLSESSFWELPRKPIKINCIRHLGQNTSGTTSLFIYGPLENNPMENKQWVATGTHWIWNAIKVSGFLSRESVSKAQQPPREQAHRAGGRKGLPSAP